jgi:flavin reductase (DIM6/NTAB) family NADH-FMN oxidoreductase RutF
VAAASWGRRPVIAVEGAGDQALLRMAYGCFPSGVTILAAKVDGQPVGMTVSSFTSVSIDPPLVSVCIKNGSRTWSRICAAASLGLSILGADQEHVGRRLAGQAVDRFAGLPVEITPAGAVFLRGAPAWLECAIGPRICAGDHELVLLRVLGVDAEPGRSPLVYHASGFHTLPRQAQELRKRRNRNDGYAWYGTST